MRTRWSGGSDTGGARRRAVTASILQRAQRQLQQLRPLVERVSSRRRGRGCWAATRTSRTKSSVSSNRIRSTIRKGKISKPNEFGNLVTIQEAEHQIITAYEVHAGRPADARCGRGPWTGIRRSSTARRISPPAIAALAPPPTNRPPTDRGVRRVILPRRGPKSPARRAHERQAWFRRGQRWRVGCEGRISVIKRRHGLRRCRYHGTDGMARWVGLGVIADNLMNIATFVNARAAA